MMKIGIVIGMIGVLGGSALAENTKPPQMTAEQRSKMAHSP